MDILKQTKEFTSLIGKSLQGVQDKELTLEEYDFWLKICAKIEKNAISIRNFINKNLAQSEKNSTLALINMENNFRSYSDYSVTSFGKITKIEMPPLLHKKVFSKDKNSQEYCENYRTFKMIDANLYAVLKHFAREKNICPYREKCLLVIKNIVDKSTPKTFITDTDNHEYKMLINTISSIFLVDDSPDFVAHLHDTETGDTNKTVVYIIPYDEFDRVISNAIALEKRSEFREVA